MSYTCWSSEAPAQFKAKVNHMVLPTLGEWLNKKWYLHLVSPNFSVRTQFA